MLFSRIRTGLMIAGGIGLLFALAWGWRVDGLRAGWKAKAENITSVAREVHGVPRLSVDQAPDAIRAIGADRDQYRRERDNARSVVETQSESIRRYEAESNRLRSISAQQAELAARLIRDRDQWIARAQAASTRTERLTCEEELRQVEEVLNALYQADF